MRETAEKPLAFHVRDLSFRYDHSPDRGWALSNVECSIRAGTIVGIIGPNGSGENVVS